jgi:hypothetical protein
MMSARHALRAADLVCPYTQPRLGGRVAWYRQVQTAIHTQEREVTPCDSCYLRGRERAGESALAC